MPIISKEMKKASKKALAQEKRQKEQEEHRLREEQTQKEQQEREAKEKEELQKQHKLMEKKHKIKDRKEKLKKEKQQLERRTNMRKELAFIKKGIAAKDINDEEVLSRHGFSITRTEVGSGTYSKTYKAKQGDNENMVCKVIILEKCPLNYKDLLKAESLKIQRFVGSGGEGGVAKHPNFVKVYDIFATNAKVYIFVDECQNLSIQTRLKGGDAITEEEAKRWIKQTAEALNCLASMGVSHLNCRPENIIFDKENVVKVVGLGMASIYWDSDMEQVIDKKKISVKDKKDMEKMSHLPPEAFTQDFNASLADVWSLGTLMCQLIGKDTPFKVKSKTSFEDQWRTYAESHQFSDEAKQLLDRIFVSDTNTRIKMDELLTDPYLKSV